MSRRARVAVAAVASACAALLADSAAAAAAAPAAAVVPARLGGRRGQPAALYQGADDDRPGRRLAEAIDACPSNWEDFFHPQALELVCVCALEKVTWTPGTPATTNDHSHSVQACPTTTQRMAKTTPPPTTTTITVSAVTTTRTTTSTTLYCQACVPVTAGPTIRTSTMTRTTTISSTHTTTTTTSRTSSTSTVTATDPPTTTSTTTSTTKTTTVTTTTVADETTSATVTRTSTSTTNTRTLTSSTATTTVLESCSICPLYHYLCPEGCTNCVGPGSCRTIFQRQEHMFDAKCDLRQSITPLDACVEFVDVQLSCPADNLSPGRPAILDNGAYPKMRCRVCGIADLQPDANAMENEWAGQVSWGPNQHLNEISETDIASYKLYVVDAQYQKLGLGPVATQEVKFWASLEAPECCDIGFYTANLNIKLPQNFTYFMVVPVTKAGLEMNVGPVSQRIVDNSRLKSVSSFGRRLAPSPASWLLPVAVALAIAPLLAPRSSAAAHASQDAAIRRRYEVVCS